MPDQDRGLHLTRRDLTRALNDLGSDTARLAFMRVMHALTIDPIYTNEEALKLAAMGVSNRPIPRSAETLARELARLVRAFDGDHARVLREQGDAQRERGDTQE